MIERKSALLRLAVVCTVGAVPSLAILFLLSLTPAFRDQKADLAAIFLPLLLPVPAMLWAKLTQAAGFMSRSHYKIGLIACLVYLLIPTGVTASLPKFGYMVSDMRGVLGIATALHGFFAVAIGGLIEK